MLVDATSIHEERDWQAVLEATKPPRENRAGVCLHCGERGCDAPACIAWHEASCWMVCPDCDGEEWTDTLRPCGCIFGVVEVAPRSPWRGGSLSPARDAVGRRTFRAGGRRARSLSG